MDARPMNARPLRIAMMLESDGPGGAEVMILRLSEELRRRGHYVLPVGPAHGVGWLGDQFRRTGFAPEVFRLRRPMDPGCVLGLQQHFRAHGIDVVHSHEFTMAVYGAAAARLLGVPHVITLHGSVTMCNALRRRVALRWAMRAADATVAVSRATQRQFSQELGWLPGRFTVIPNGVPVTRGDAGVVRYELGIVPGDVVVLAVGNLDIRKGHRQLIEALAMLDDRLPWKLVIAGGRGGEQHDPLLELVRERGLEKRVHILTHRDDIPDLLAATDVFAMPSLWEGLPMAMLEAMLAGKAIVASATAGIPEAVESGREGLLVSPGDVPALSGALRTLIMDASRRAKLGAAAAARAHTEFTTPVMCARYEALYHAAVAGRAPEAHSA